MEIDGKYYTVTIVIDSTLHGYFAVDSNILTGVYLTLSDFNTLTNNRIIAPNGFAFNDNVFDYPTIYYGINSNGIAFKLLDGSDVVIYNINKKSEWRKYFN